MVKRIIKRIPGVQDVNFELRSKLKEWNVDVAGTQIALFMPASYVDLYTADDRKGQLTGVDQHGRYEYTFAAAFRTCLNSDTILLDVGAAQGLYSILAQKIGCRKVICFEPEPFSNWILRKNNKCYCGGKLVIDSRKISALSSDKDSVSIDDYCEDTGVIPSLIKMDIEGFEYFAVQGMKRVCSISRPVILMEFHHRKMRDKLRVNQQTILDQLRNWGYTLKFNGHHYHTGQNSGVVDDQWHEIPSSEVNYAVWAKPV